MARELERQIEREQERKNVAEKETEEVFTLLDRRLEEHLKITQVEESRFYLINVALQT